MFGFIFFSSWWNLSTQKFNKMVRIINYKDVKKAQVTSTFDEQTCKALIGTEIEGEIIKKECEPYDYTNKETGEIISLTHRWVYQPREEKQVPEQVSNYTDMQQYQGNMARA